MSKISIFIRAKNEAEELSKVLRKIYIQDRKADEVVVLDNESEDATRQVASDHGAIVQGISRAEFTYGRALNLSVELTQGDVIVFLSAHSFPVDNSWLRNLVSPIEENDAPICFGRQVPMPGANHLEEWFLYRTFPKQPSTAKSLLGLQKILFSNANAAVLASLLRDHPFREDLAFAEDLEWAKRVKAHGARILYRPNAAVYHSHHLGPGDLEKRMEKVGRSMAQQGIGVAYRNAIICQAVKWATMFTDLIYCISRGYWKTIPRIWLYRSEYFTGLCRGLISDVAINTDT